MSEKLINMLKNKDLIVPYQLFIKYKELNLDEKELIILIYIINTNNVFNPKEISNTLNIELNEVLSLIDSLSEKDIIEIKTIKNNGIREEIIDTNNLYKKLCHTIINEDVKEEESADIYSKFEKEFGRSLSPVEYEFIGGWIEAKISEDIIELALKEAVYNGVTNLRYIDSIINNWTKKGIKTKEDVLKDKKEFANKKSNKKELFDYDWLNEE